MGSPAAPTHGSRTIYCNPPVEYALACCADRDCTDGCRGGRGSDASSWSCSDGLACLLDLALPCFLPAGTAGDTPALPSSLPGIPASAYSFCLMALDDQQPH